MTPNIGITAAKSHAINDNGGKEKSDKQKTEIQTIMQNINKFIGQKQITPFSLPTQSAKNEPHKIKKLVPPYSKLSAENSPGIIQLIRQFVKNDRKSTD